MASEIQESELVPVLHPELFYWSKAVQAKFRLGRPLMTELKRQFPEDVRRCKRGDMVRGQAVLDYLKTWGQAAS